MGQVPKKLIKISFGMGEPPKNIDGIKPDSLKSNLANDGVAQPEEEVQEESGHIEILKSLLEDLKQIPGTEEVQAKIEKFLADMAKGVSDSVTEDDENGILSDIDSFFSKNRTANR